MVDEVDIVARNALYLRLYIYICVIPIQHGSTDSQTHGESLLVM